jgi:hypothetical protein
MTLYLDLPDAEGKLDRLIRHYGARALPGRVASAFPRRPLTARQSECEHLSRR